MKRQQAATTPHGVFQALPARLLMRRDCVVESNVQTTQQTGNTKRRFLEVIMHPYLTRTFLLSLTVSACAGDNTITGVVDQCRLTSATTLSADSATAAGRWNAVTRGVVLRREFGPLGVVRTFALVSVAEYNAIVSADAATQSGTLLSEAGAAAGAAATVLVGLYPAEQGVVDAQLSSDAALISAVASGCGAQFTAGVAAGRLVGAAVLASAATDRSMAQWTGVAPTGPGVWTSAPAPATPLSPMWGQARPWFMISGSQFRPAAPPAFGSAAYQTALAEVRTASDTRTPEQLRIAQYWGLFGATAGPQGMWSITGLGLALQNQRDELATARMLAMMHMAGMDASIGCWDAKYAYWYLRPFQADAAITTPVGRPNFPSYPSAHSCLSAAYASVLAGLFPSASSNLAAQLDEAGVSRIYAGLHFRFDVDAGQQIGKSIGALALTGVPSGVAIPLK